MARCALSVKLIYHKSGDIKSAFSCSSLMSGLLWIGLVRNPTIRSSRTQAFMTIAFQSSRRTTFCLRKVLPLCFFMSSSISSSPTSDEKRLRTCYKLCSVMSKEKKRRSAATSKPFSETVLLRNLTAESVLLNVLKEPV